MALACIIYFLSPPIDWLIMIVYIFPLSSLSLSVINIFLFFFCSVVYCCLFFLMVPSCISFPFRKDKKQIVRSIIYTICNNNDVNIISIKYNTQDSFWLERLVFYVLSKLCLQSHSLLRYFQLRFIFLYYTNSILDKWRSSRRWRCWYR
jgi:hypothetical protein